MKNSDLGTKLLAIGLLFVVIVACKNLESIGAPTVLNSPDGKFQITVPSDWNKTSELNDKANIQAENKRKEMYVVVLSETADDLSSDMTLDKFLEITKKSLMSKYDGPEATEAESISINGNDARQYELKGTMQKQNTKIAIIVTDVKTPAYYHQVLTWTLPSKMDENKDTLRKVAASFREASQSSPSANNQ